MRTVVMQTKHQKHDSNHAHVPGQRFDIHAIGFGSHRRYGELAEAKFLAKAAGMGFGVSRPWGDERYDFVLDSSHRFSRVQVKSTRKSRAPRSYGVVVSSNRLAAYDATEIDFLVAYVVPLDLWVCHSREQDSRNDDSVFPSRRMQIQVGEVSRGLVPDGLPSRRERPQQDRDAAMLRQRPNPPADLPPEAVALRRPKASTPSREAAYELSPHREPWAKVRNDPATQKWVHRASPQTL